MGMKRETVFTNVERKKVYLVKRICHLPSEDKVIRAFTSLEKANLYIKEYEEENKLYLREDINNFGGRYTWFDPPYDSQYMLRIEAHELDCDYDESVCIYCNPRED